MICTIMKAPLLLPLSLSMLLERNWIDPMSQLKGHKANPKILDQGKEIHEARSVRPDSLPASDIRKADYILMLLLCNSEKRMHLLLLAVPPKFHSLLQFARSGKTSRSAVA